MSQGPVATRIRERPIHDGGSSDEKPPCRTLRAAATGGIASIAA